MAQATAGAARGSRPAVIGQPDCALHSEAARRGAAGGPRSIERQGRDYREIGKGRRAEGGSVRSARELVGALPRQHTHALRNTPPETRASTLAHTGKPAVARLVGPAREPRRQPAARSRPADPSHAISEIPSHAIGQSHKPLVQLAAAAAVAATTLPRRLARVAEAHTGDSGGRV